MESWRDQVRTLGRAVVRRLDRRRERGAEFRDRQPPRYWWHRLPDSGYVPALYAFLDDAEWEIIDAWFADTDRVPMHGEMQVPAMSVLQGFVMGSGIRNIVELGCYAGYSTLLLGFMMRHMGFRRGLFTVDLSAEAYAYTAGWVARAGLGEYVSLVNRDSCADGLAEEARSWFGGPIRSVFIDSSHQYGQTVAELDRWYPEVSPGGLLFLHDTSAFGASLDSTGQGGVQRAFNEWIARTPGAASMNFNAWATADITTARVYRDKCGFAVVQRPA